MSDVISRQAAIDALRTCYDTETVTMDNGDEYINYGDAVGEIEQLPPAQLGTNLAGVGTEERAEERTETHACDCINRQQAIDEIDEWIKAFRENGHKESAADACLIQDGIIQLPPAQPEIVRCKDCNHFYKDNLNQWCFLGKYGVKENGFCSRAERRTDE